MNLVLVVVPPVQLVISCSALRAARGFSVLQKQKAQTGRVLRPTQAGEPTFRLGPWSRLDFDDFEEAVTKPHEGGTWADQQDQQEGGSANTADRIWFGTKQRSQGYRLAN